MPIIDLRQHIVSASGTWQDPQLLAEQSPFPFTLSDTKSAQRLMLRWPGDSVVLAGPLRLRVTLQSENLTYGLTMSPGVSVPADDVADGVSTSEGAMTTAGAQQLQSGTIYSYVLDVPAGQAWPMESVTSDLATRHGANFGHRVIVEPAIEAADCKPTYVGSDVPCDFAVGQLADTSSFFPAACEPCSGGSIGLPPGGSSLGIPVAQGGCVRPRYFDGMFVTREDMQTEQMYFRVKHRLQNRAAGHGVVWGLGVGQSAGYVCVQPGYGVDCCGNDLVITSTYKVDIPTLLRDPLAAPAIHAGRATPMHLLLEYVECPDAPRPVHADPCVRTSDRCEMSRIRETVRLRLVPPREPATTGPLKTFLDRVEALAAKYPLEQADLPMAATQTPFEIVVEATGTDGAVAEVRVRPGTDFNAGALNTLSSISTVTISVANDPGWMMTAATLNALVGETALADAEPLDAEGLRGTPRPITFEGVADAGELRWELTDWVSESVLAAVGSPGRTSSTTLVMAAGERGVSLAVDQGEVEARAPSLADAPCGPPCRTPRQAAAGVPAPEEDSPFPWLHADPTNTASTGDPKSLILAALGSWLMQLTAQAGVGTAGETELARRKAAAALYQGAWLLLFGVDDAGDKADVGAAVRELFAGWCQHLLYPGPSCEHEPDGVVLGCTVVSGGQLGPIDPFGGRRHVVHYPLLAHWGAQLGLAPPDVVASRFLSTICCVAGLAAPSVEPVAEATLVQVGAGYLAFGTADEVAAAVQEETGWTITTSETLTLAPFIARVLQAVTDGDDPASVPAAHRYTLGGAVTPGILSLVIADT